MYARAKMTYSPYSVWRNVEVVLDSTFVSE
jgi:hypothetical protein